VAGTLLHRARGREHAIEGATAGGCTDAARIKFWLPKCGRSGVGQIGGLTQQRPNSHQLRLGKGFKESGSGCRGRSAGRDRWAAISRKRKAFELLLALVSGGCRLGRTWIQAEALLRSFLSVLGPLMLARRRSGAAESGEPQLGDRDKPLKPPACRARLNSQALLSGRPRRPIHGARASSAVGRAGAMFVRISGEIAAKR